MTTDKPFDVTNSTNPWLMERECRTPITGPEGLPLTAEYIWSKSGQDRVDLMNWVFDYYRNAGYPFFKLTAAELTSDFQALKNKNPNEIFVNGVIKNSNTTGLDISKHFTDDLFLNTKCAGNKRSCLDVFNDDAEFKKVLKNRMGWKTSGEGGSTRPYVFAIDDRMIFQGMRSSGLGSSVSFFKPMIAKYIYAKYGVKKVIDYSCGWGARCIAALSLGVEYYGIDPLTSDRINDMIKYFGGTGFSVLGCSEQEDYSVFPDVDMCFSCPPYFNLEIYSTDETQSSHYDEYSIWLENYWRPTVKKCYPKCQKFSLVAVEKVGKNDLLQDMMKICEEEGGKLLESIPIKTSAGHLSNKATTKKTTKKTESVVVYEVK
jgi:hypothetical protein